MPAGELLADRVANLLSLQQAQSVNEIARGIVPPVTGRAIRYALDALIKSGRAKRLGHRNQHYKVLAVERLREQAAPKG